MKLLNFIIIRLTIFLIVGISIGYYTNLAPIIIVGFTCVTLIALGVFYVLTLKRYTHNAVFRGLSYILILSIGMLAVSINSPKNKTLHYTNMPFFNSNAVYAITFKVKAILKPTRYYDTYKVSVSNLNSNTVIGTVLLQLKKDTIQHTALQVDDIYATKTQFKPLPKALNPGAFDYGAYLNRQYIYHRLQLSPNAIVKTSVTKASLLGISSDFRNFCISQLHLYPFTSEQLAIIKALFLGQKQDISPKVYNNYVNAGLIHLLALSGLHIGIITFILNFLFQPLSYFKWGQPLKAMLIIGVLWGFAFMSGLSPSVVRAVTMFSIFTIGMHLKRPSNSYNTLAISMFFILLFKPLLLFDVGFQLSYAAVLGIISLYPIFYKFWQPRYRLLNFYWRTLIVTLSAQIGILPLSLFYFHQFPTLFFISNCVLVPLMPVILGMGIFVVGCALLQLLPLWLAELFGKITDLMTAFASWMSGFDGFIFTEIPFHISFVVTGYGLIICFFRYINLKNYKRLVYLLSTMVVILLAHIYVISTTPKTQFIVFNAYRNSLVGVVHNDTLRAYTSRVHPNSIKSFARTQYIGNLCWIDSIPSLHTFNSKTVLVVDSLAAYRLKTFKPDYILLRSSPKLSLQRLIQNLQPSCIIADGSNYTSFIERWKVICSKNNIPFHDTGTDGAFILKH